MQRLSFHTRKGITWAFEKVVLCKDSYCLERSKRMMKKEAECCYAQAARSDWGRFHFLASPFGGQKVENILS